MITVAGVPVAETPQILASNVDMLYILFLAALAIITWSAKRAFNSVCANQTKLFEKFDDHEKRLSTIEGAHFAVMAEGGHKGG